MHVQGLACVDTRVETVVHRYTMAKQTIPAPTQGRVVLFKDDLGIWPAIVQDVSKADQITLAVFTPRAGAYLGKRAAATYGKDKEGCWWWPEKSDATIEVGED